jgi:hypothetical protein
MPQISLRLGNERAERTLEPLGQTASDHSGGVVASTLESRNQQQQRSLTGSSSDALASDSVRRPAAEVRDRCTNTTSPRRLTEKCAGDHREPERLTCFLRPAPLIFHLLCGPAALQRRDQPLAPFWRQPALSFRFATLTDGCAGPLAWAASGQSKPSRSCPSTVRVRLWSRRSRKQYQRARGAEFEKSSLTSEPSTKSNTPLGVRRECETPVPYHETISSGKTDTADLLHHKEGYQGPLVPARRNVRV